MKRETKEEAAARIYPGLTCDTALPQAWLDSMAGYTGAARSHFSKEWKEETYEVLRAGVVWGYPPRNALGLPFPVSKAAELKLRVLFEYAHGEEVERLYLDRWLSLRVEGEDYCDE